MAGQGAALGGVGAVPGLVLGGTKGAQREVTRAVFTQGWVGKVLILVLSGALFWGAVPGTALHSSRGRCPAPRGEGTLLGCLGRQQEPPLPPGRAHPSPPGAEEMLSPPAS